MASLSPNMGMTIPTVGVDTGPAWAQFLDACLYTIDGHDHSSGNGVKLSQSGINISPSTPFAMNGADVVDARTVALRNQASGFATLLTDLTCFFAKTGDLYYVNGNNQTVRITNGTAVAGTPGSITGITGNASAAYNGGTYTFQSDVNTPAVMNVGPVSIGLQTAGSHTVTLSPSAGMSGNIELYLPTAIPSVNGYMAVSTSGNMTVSNNGIVPLGGIIAFMENSFYSLPGSGVIKDGWMLCDGGIIPVGGVLTGATPVINDGRFIQGYAAGGSGVSGDASISLTDSLSSATPISVTAAHTHYLSANGQAQIGQYLNRMVMANTGASFIYTRTATYHDYYEGSDYPVNEAVTSTGTAVEGAQLMGRTDGASTGTFSGTVDLSHTHTLTSTTGVVPRYITAVYLIRVA